LLQPKPFAVGGGWHLAQNRAEGEHISAYVLLYFTDLAYTNHSESTRLRPTKHAVDTSESTFAAKRLRAADPDNTDTESETDEEPAPPANALPAPPPPPAPAVATSAPPLNRGPPLTRTQPLTRVSTATTVLDTPLEGQPPRSSYLNDLLTHYGSIDKLLADSNLLCRPGHARLKAKTIERKIKRDIAKARSRVAEADKDPGMDEIDYEMHYEMHYEMERVPNELQQTSVPPSQRTYAGARSHLSTGTKPNDRLPSRAMADTPPPSRPTTERSSRSIRSRVDRTIDNLYSEVEAAEAALQAARAEARGRSCIRPRRAEPSTQPKTHSSQKAGASALPGKSRRLDPVATARADMVAFNKQCARENTASFVQSVTRQTERRARCDPVERQSHDLLSDDEEERTHAAASTKGKQPVSFRPPSFFVDFNICLHVGRSQKKAPCARLSGHSPTDSHSRQDPSICIRPHRRNLSDPRNFSALGRVDT
jgi:hypothetical protein